MSLIFVDVEANGKTPFSGVMSEFGAIEYESRASYHGVLWEAYPDPANPARSHLTVASTATDEKQFTKEYDVMGGFANWLTEVCGESRPIFVSDNPAFDFMWVAYYFDKTLGRNPFGHSGRRISDFYAGLMRDFSKSQEWKRWRVTPHDHHPVHDALGNVEAFEKLLVMAAE